MTNKTRVDHIVNLIKSVMNSTIQTEVIETLKNKLVVVSWYRREYIGIVEKETEKSVQVRLLMEKSRSLSGHGFITWFRKHKVKPLDSLLK